MTLEDIIDEQKKKAKEIQNSIEDIMTTLADLIKQNRDLFLLPEQLKEADNEAKLWHYKMMIIERTKHDMANIYYILENAIEGLQTICDE